MPQTLKSYIGVVLQSTVLHGYIGVIDLGWGKRTPDKRTLPQRTQAKGPWTKGPSKLKDPGSKGPWTKRTLVKGPWGKRTLGKRTLKKRTLGKRTLKKGPSKYIFFNFYFFMA